MRSTSTILALLALSHAGCPEQGYEGLTVKYPENGETSGETLTSGSTTAMPTPTTTTDAVTTQTVTDASDDTEEATTVDPSTTTTTGPQDNVPPTIDLFTVIGVLPNAPKQLGEAGPAEIQLVVSADVVKVHLTLDGEKLADLNPVDFPRTWDALSAKDNGLARTFKVVVEDAEGLTAEAVDTLAVQLPASGVEKCSFPNPDEGSVISVVSALKYTHTAIVAVGTRDTGAGPRMTVWMLDPNDCLAVPGWPKSVADWSTHDDYKKLGSIGVAVDVDAVGNIVVAGNLWVGNKLQGYVALLDGTGARLWEQAGQPGDEITSVAAATGQFKDRVFVGGSLRTSDNPVSTDGAIWIYQANGEMAFVSSPFILAAPFTEDELDDDEDNVRSEWVRAMLIQPGTSNVLAVGEREFKDDQLLLNTRAFTVQVHPLSGVIGMPWTSWAPSFKHDAARSVTLCGDHFLAAGWTRDVPVGATPRPMIFWIEDDGTSIKHRDEPQLGATQINGIACDAEAKIVSAATRDTGPRDARVFAAPGQNGPLTWYENGALADDEANAVACDWRGFCGWGGYRTTDGKPYAVVRVHHP